MGKSIKFFDFFIKIVGTILGAMIMAAATGLFLLPNHLSTGGFSGIATIVYYLYHVPMGVTILVLNLPLFIIALFKIGRGFLIRAVVGTMSFSFFVDWFDKFKPFTTNGFLACIYGGILVGLGTSIILRSSASTGGTDLVSNILVKFFPHIKISSPIMIIDTIIVFMNVVAFKEIEIGLYSAIAIYLYSKVIDIVFEGVNFTKLLIIISNNNDKISKKIEQEIKRGVTRIIWKRNVYRK